MTDTASAAPVAWRVHPFDYGIGHEGVYAMTLLEQQRDAWLRKGWKVEPLYVAPPAVVEPLTVQQIWASDEIMSANAMPIDDLLRIVRAVEAAHGIGVKKGESNGLTT